MKTSCIYIALVVTLLSSCIHPNEKGSTAKAIVSQAKSPKRGVSFGYQFVDDINVLSKGISWSYNWAPAQDEMFDKVAREKAVDFCPMAWNGIDKEVLRDYVKRNPDCSYLLAINEPNLVDQANMTPREVADKWPDIKSIASELGLKVISPAMNYGTLEGYHDPVTWLDEFFTLVPIDEVDAISIHCYMSHPSAVKWYIERFKKYNKPVWLTEFCAWDGLNEETYTAADQQMFMSDVINYLECEPLIERYAWFLPRGGKSEKSFPYMFLLKNSTSVELTDLGKVYTQLSTMDKNTYYTPQQKIEAEHYSSICISECIGNEGWIGGPRVRVCTDASDESLELFDFKEEHWVEYQIEAPEEGEYEFDIRYASENGAQIDLNIDGLPNHTLLLSNTGGTEAWQTVQASIKLLKGKQTIRIKLNSGVMMLNWFSFS
ncbi:cellulase family glycosylhydrolase [Carboxylicivirga sp. RSCT41]|uniref:cellulase family glycosylhydrolase n=1 Tax=Carboxylicivirga agarovorans TaxID=3417570 RepID=UPI003D345234